METKPDFTLPLSASSGELQLVGGKGLSLAKLARAGLPVPPGFHITTAAYRWFVTEHALQDQILAAVSAVDPDQPATLDDASSWKRTLLMASAVVTDIGGPLSHGSIVAREYGIPAVMATGAATRRIQTGQTITVDGTFGTVSLG